MRAGLVIVALCSSFWLATSEVVAAEQRSGYHPPLIHRFDLNQDGRMNTMERAAGRLTRSQQREWRAVRRNDPKVR